MSCALDENRVSLRSLSWLSFRILIHVLQAWQALYCVRLNRRPGHPLTQVRCQTCHQMWSRVKQQQKIRKQLVARAGCLASLEESPTPTTSGQWDAPHFARQHNRPARIFAISLHVALEPQPWGRLAKVPSLGDATLHPCSGICTQVEQT